MGLIFIKEGLISILFKHTFLKILTFCNSRFQRVSHSMEGVTRRPRDLKVLVDSMILGLGKHLRR